MTSAARTAACSCTGAAAATAWPGRSTAFADSPATDACRARSGPRTRAGASAASPRRRCRARPFDLWPQAAADSSAARPGSLQRLHLHRENAREVAHDSVPAASVIRGRVHLAAASAEVDAARIETVDRHRVAQDVDVAVLLRQALRQRFPFVATGLAAVDAQLAVGHEVVRVARDRQHVHRLRLVRVDVDYEAKIGRQVAADLSPVVATV